MAKGSVRKKGRNARMYEALRDYGDRIDTVGVFSFKVREKLYQITMSIIRQMRKTHLVTDEEYRQLDTIFAQKYEPIFGGLYAGTDLL